MKAIVCEKPSQMLLREEMKAQPRKSGEATVSIRRIGICGTDYHAFHGNQPFFSYPRILGHELAGEIQAIDAHPTLSVGDRVAVIPYLHCGKCGACIAGKSNCCEQLRVLGVHVDGGMCEEINVPVDNLLKVNELSYDHSALIEPFAIGAHAVRRAHIEAGESVLVIGAGPIGLGVMFFAKERGADVIALDTNPARLDFCRRWLELEHVVQLSDQTEAAIKQATGGRLPSIVLDATGNAASMMKAFDYVGHGGTLVYVGLVKQEIQFYDPDFHQKEITLKGSRNATDQDFIDVAHAFKQTTVNLDAYITHTAPFADAIPQFQTWIKPETNVIKAMIYR
ncbi:zinc-binding alcohol dehydrogenase family protein [Desmospora activa]|uniref:2-desacetyl-2-hydroxyethyl bacteriochlorophyllide A dehydrogenase n=1 Tax=Desmospora activa DSM 45169 TaxID=1121389 RepID=A0A2T4ZBC6_9BACL|nr:zinc-binding alcohol dehydrogenase family protein [Desmospora activa]PTM59177.1 hypothetical protein C8J48_1780 [Desmospora activa DSM 45169]